MASESGRQETRAPTARKALRAALFLVAVLLAACVWLFGSASGARALLHAASALGGASLDTQDVEGSIASPLHIGRLRLASHGNVIELSGLKFVWRPLDLLRGTLRIESLHVGHLQFTGAGEEKREPKKPPARIGLPLQLQADDVRLGSGEIRSGPGAGVKLGPLSLRLGFDGTRYRLNLQRLAAGAEQEGGKFSADFSGTATLSAVQPYAVDGRFSSDSRATVDGRVVGATGTIDLNGSLEQLETAIAFAVNQASIDGSVVLSPFSDIPLGRARLHARAIDLAQFAPGLPETSLELRLVADDQGMGELNMLNGIAGTYDAGRLPLQSLFVAFRQEAGGMQAERIDASLGTKALPAGKLQGEGRFGTEMTLTLRTDGMDLKRLDRRARGTHLAGQADLRQSGETQEIRLSLTEPLERQQKLSLDAHAVRSPQELSLRRAQLRAGNGSVDLSGHMALTGAQAFDASGIVNNFRLRELGRFAQLPELELNGKFSLRGARAPRLEAHAAFSIADSRLANQPLSGDGEVRLLGEHLEVPRLRLASGANRLQAEGRLTGDNARLSFELDAPRLGQLGPSFAGALKATGTARGTLARPQIAVDWSASGARLPGAVRFDRMQGKARLALDRSRAFILDSGMADVSASGLAVGAERLSELAAHLRFSPQPDAPLTLRLQAKGIATARLDAERLLVTARGTTGAHTIDLALDETGQAWSMTASGGLAHVTAAPTWKGNIQSLDAKGRFVARLAGPAAVLVSAERVQVDNFLLDADSGRFAVDTFSRDETGIVTRGRLERLQLAQLLRRLRQPPPVKTDLELSGEWNVRIADTLAGTLALRRERGDVTVLANAPVTLGLAALSANANVAAGRLAVEIHAEGKRLGRIDVNGGTTIGHGGKRIALAPDAPLTGSARIDMPSLAWIGPLLSPSLFLDGSLHGDVALGGTLDRPRPSGNIRGEALRLSLADMGLDLRQGSLDSAFQGERLLIRALSFQGAEGSVSLSGPLDFSGGSVDAQLALLADRFALLNRSDRRIVVSGASELTWRNNQGKASGTYTVNSGFIDLGSPDKPQLSSDVVVVGRERKNGAGKTAFDVDITIALGDGIVLRGRGLDAVLAGQVQLIGNAGEALRAQGTLNIAKGTYTAYGRELAIEQGVLRFRGALNNPSLDILAMRRGQEVEAGVSIRGTALTPRVTLVSEPPVPEAEKLSWLVLGRGLATAGDTDIGALQSAAGALLSEGAKASVQSRIAGGLGLDTFSIGTSQDSLQQRIVTIGKQVSSRLYLSYQQGLESAGSVVQVRYVLSPKLSLEAEAGTRGALSLFYNIAFD